MTLIFNKQKATSNTHRSEFLSNQVSPSRPGTCHMKLQPRASVTKILRSRSSTRKPAATVKHSSSKMVLCTVFVVSICIFGSHHVEATPETLSTLDSTFCHGGLEVIYPELDIDECLIIPKPFREKISTVWKAPDIYFSAAYKSKLYALVMVDPDAPSRANPTKANWRHWLLVDIQGTSLKKGQIKGTTLTEYHPPTPPRNSGFHRYQFMLFEQPLNAQVTLTELEKANRGNWDLEAFIKRTGLGAPVATVQYLTQNYID